jgi:hypothetical protein
MVLSVEADADLNSWTPTENKGYNAFLPVRTFGYKRPVFRFNLNELPEGAVLDRAVFRAQSSDTEGPAVEVELIGLLKPWAEHETTWELAATGEPWAEPGANAPGIDRLGYATSSALVSGGEAWWEWDITPLVRDWWSGDLTNHGFMLVSWQTDIQREISFVAKDHGYPSQLVIEYLY